MKAPLTHTLALILLPAAFIGCAPSSDGTANSSDTPVRHIQLEGEPNFRDLGGYQTTDGRTVKWRQVFRTGELGKLTDADVEKLEKLELKTMVNFLLPQRSSNTEKTAYPKAPSLCWIR